LSFAPSFQAAAKDFKTDFKINKSAYEVYLSGVEVTKKEYDKF